ncbi:MAG: hypothetical protein J6J24_01825, partial [Clostridia bacterium]|nr:hypothetical protein [Clostridia bacterium]
MMRKIFKSFLILFVFCLSFTLCGTFTFSTDNAYADAATIIKLANATDDTKGVKGFADYVNGYAAANVNDNLILTEDIVLTTDLTNTIGTAAAPFAGTFNGRGYKILNATVDLSGTSSDNQYLGIFGYVQGSSTKRATIKNLSISGNLTLKAANPISLFAGGFAGFAKCAFFENVQLNANVVANFSNDFNLTFGNMIGQMVDSEINGAICRPTAVSVFEIDNTDAKFYSLGGVVGEQNNSQIFFAVVNETIKVDIAPEFIGDLNVGGISGKISQGGSKIINVALENGYEIKGRETNLNLETTIKVGQIAGLVANPAPASNAETRIMSLSYIHYADNKDVSLFGDLGGYKFVEQSTKDYITVSTEVFGTEEYFS